PAHQAYWLSTVMAVFTQVVANHHLPAPIGVPSPGGGVSAAAVTSTPFSSASEASLSSFPLALEHLAATSFASLLQQHYAALLPLIAPAFFPAAPPFKERCGAVRVFRVFFSPFAPRCRGCHGRRAPPRRPERKRSAVPNWLCVRACVRLASRRR